MSAKLPWLALAVVGLGIGLLTGLSVGPVLSIILTSLVGAAATVTAIFGRYGGQGTDTSTGTSKRDLVPQPAPLALLVVTILIGALTGMILRVDLATSQQAARMRGLDLAPPSTISESIQAWTALGLDKAKVTQSLFEAYLGVAKTEAEKVADQTARARTPGFFAVASADECARFRNAPDTNLRSEMQAAESATIADIAKQVDDAEVLRLVVKVACDKEAQ